MRASLFALLCALAGCGDSLINTASDAAVAEPPDAAIVDAAVITPEGPLGARFDDNGGVRFSVYSSRATRIDLYLYSQKTGAPAVLNRTLVNDPKTGVWSVTVPASDLAPDQNGNPILYYGYRAFGPNWPYDPAWTPGSQAGFFSDVDGAGNRFNPNKLLFDPYALELSHDPLTPSSLDSSLYATGPQHRGKDSGPIAAKGVLFHLPSISTHSRPTRALTDDVIYEVHVRGLTMSDGSLPADCPGTFKAAAQRAADLAATGITAIEFQPVQEFQNDTNGLRGPGKDNYWGYNTLGWFAPDRHYACDQSPGGPTREFQSMVDAFHDQGIKVFLDVVYNHTGEGGLWDKTGDVAASMSMRGLDDAAYYELADNARFFQDNTGCCGGNVNAAHPATRQLIVDSLKHWHDDLGVDGFRFDLAPILGNKCLRGCFQFDGGDPKNVLNRAVKELPARPAGGGAGADLIAEPWANGNGTYQIGHFPIGWSEWNGVFRDTFRKAQNRLGTETITPRQLGIRFAGSFDMYKASGRTPGSSINYIVSHDGYDLRDLYSYNADPGQFAWDQGGDAALQRQAARTGLALPLLSVGTPMITGGDEIYRTVGGITNPYNIDDTRTWIDWSNQVTYKAFYSYAKHLFAFRTAHPALRPNAYFTGADHDGNGLKDITFIRDNGQEADDAYFDDGSRHFLAFRIDGAEAKDTVASIYVAYNAGDAKVRTTLPNPQNGKHWYRVADTAAWMEPRNNFTEPGAEDRIDSPIYDVLARSILLMIER